MTTDWTIQRDHTYIPELNNGEECNLCGLNFAHFHKAGTLPKDFERIPERVADVGKTIQPLIGICSTAELQAKINEIIKYINEKPTQKTNL